MARVVWNDAGERAFEAGVDQGVLYPDNFPGVPWNGLISVAEAPTNGEVEPYYLDGVKYLNFGRAEEFEATIEAFSRPIAFAQCEGNELVGNGLYVTQQRKSSFGMSYRTMVGNDTEGSDHAYKIHLVYNAMVNPTARTYNTVGETIEPMNLAWSVVTKPMVFPGQSRLVSHVVLDSRGMSESLTADIEDILYGTDTEDPELPTFETLNSMFGTLGV